MCAWAKCNNTSVHLLIEGEGRYKGNKFWSNTKLVSIIGGQKNELEISLKEITEQLQNKIQENDKLNEESKF